MGITGNYQKCWQRTTSNTQLNHGRLKRILALIFVLMFLFAFKLSADLSGPGWHQINEAESVDPAAAQSLLSQQILEKQSENLLNSAQPSSQAQFSQSFSELIDTPELRELTRGLLNDPLRMFEYVVNRIEYVPYYGYLKGPQLTLLEQSGNDFDQAALLIVLLRTAGYSARFVYGTMTIPSAFDNNEQDIAHWLGIEQDPILVSQALSRGGIPFAFNGFDIEMTRVWVEVEIAGTT